MNEYENEHVYDPSIFWILLDKLSEPFLIIGSAIITISILLWVIKTKEKSGVIALFGSMLLLGGNISHVVIEKMHWVHISGRIPAVEENPIIFFFFLHGISYGCVFIGIPLTIHFYKLYRNA